MLLIFQFVSPTPQLHPTYSNLISKLLIHPRIQWMLICGLGALAALSCLEFTWFKRNHYYRSVTGCMEDMMRYAEIWSWWFAVTLLWMWYDHLCSMHTGDHIHIYNINISISLSILEIKEPYVYNVYMCVIQMNMNTYGGLVWALCSAIQNSVLTSRNWMDTDGVPSAGTTSWNASSSVSKLVQQSWNVGTSWNASWRTWMVSGRHTRDHRWRWTADAHAGNSASNFFKHFETSTLQT